MSFHVQYEAAMRVVHVLMRHRRLRPQDRAVEQQTAPAEA
jgi:hypothetical protein